METLTVWMLGLVWFEEILGEKKGPIQRAVEHKQAIMGQHGNVRNLCTHSI